MQIITDAGVTIITGYAHANQHYFTPYLAPM